uniref:Reverse transcriptase domain-containing protein n=1 Tax=Fagus sylvatica TaxID=28930 RepID=A0A2N9IAW3_FAGSY
MKTWDDMVEIFCGKLFRVEERVTLHTLHSVKQKASEGLLDFIKQFQDLALDCYVNHEERELIEICIDNMLPDYRAHLENLDIAQFTQLLQKARKTAALVKPVERSRVDKRSTQHALVVTSNNDTMNKKKSFKEKEFEEWPAKPCTTEEMHTVIDKCIADGFLRLPGVSKGPTEDDKKISPKFRSLFNQLGLGPDARKAATEAIVNIAVGSGSQCYTAEAHASRAFLETTNTVTFTDEDMEAHYVEAAFYDEVTPTEEGLISKVVGTPLPRWEDIKDEPDMDLRKLLEQKMKRKEQREDAPKYIEELETINLSDDPNVELSISIRSSLSLSEKAQLIPLLKEYRDVFAWQYEEMLGLEPDLVVHALNVDPGIQKLLAADFFKPIEHPQWLSNIVPVKKKNGKIRCCVDFQNLNKACPKDEFPLPNMDLLIDSAAGHTMFSFMDGFSGYNQIQMSPKDAMKTVFRTPIGNFYNTVMPFGLKNASATYQRAMTAIFHDIMHCELKDYMDDVVVKTETKEGHFKTLRRVFEQCRQYKLRMNPLKCAFEVAAGKFLGFLVHQRDIDVDPMKAKAIATMKPPTTIKELKSFLGKLSYIRRFISSLAVRVMANLPIVKAPIPGVPLRLYLASNDKAIGVLVAQEDKEGVEQPIYYTLFYGSYRAPNDEVTSYKDTSPMTRPFQKTSIMALVTFEDASSINDEVPREVGEVAFAEISDAIWTLRFDGSSTVFGGGAGVVLTKEGGDTLSMSFKLDFPCSNNAAEYEAYLTGLALARELRIKRLEDYFEELTIEYTQRSDNRHADALATLGSKSIFDGKSTDVTILKRSSPITQLLHEEFAAKPPQEEDWQLPLKESLTNPERGADLRDFKDYTLVAGELYRRLPRGVLARCISAKEAKKKLAKAQASEIQSSCSCCQHVFEKEEAYATFSTSDWRTPFLEYLLENILPETSKEAYHLKQLARRYFTKGGILFRKGLHGEPLRCLMLAKS